MAEYVERMISMEREEIYRFQEELEKYSQAVQSGDLPISKSVSKAPPAVKSSSEGQGPTGRKQAVTSQKKKSLLINRQPRRQARESPKLKKQKTESSGKSTESEKSEDMPLF